jgi:hypothetical protein
MLLSSLTLISMAFSLNECHKFYQPILNQSKLSLAGVVVINNGIAKRMTTRQTLNFVWVQESETSKLKDFIDRMMLELSRNVQFASRLASASSITPVKNRPRSMSVFLIQNFTDFLQIYQKLTSDNFKFNGITASYQIWLVDGKIKEIRKIFKLMWRIQVYNVNVMFEDEDGEVLVQTFYPFSDGSCGDTTVKTINRFKDGKFDEKVEKLFIDKMQNLHGCPIKVAIADNIPFITPKKHQGGRSSYSGRDIEVITSMANTLNFTIKITYVGPEGYLFDNGTGFGTLKALKDKEADISISDWWLKQNRLKFFDATSSYISDSSIFIVPHGSDFTALEKLVYPFRFESWMAVISVFLIAFATIQIIRRRSKIVQNFIFGKGIHDNTLNMFAVFFGVSQKRLPGRNFARYLLMMFIIYSLIIRTLYQGSFYELLKSQKRHEEIKKIDEILERDLYIYFHVSMIDHFQKNEIIRKR